MLGCSMRRFSSGEVSNWTGPAEVKHGGGVMNQDSLEKTKNVDKNSYEKSDEMVLIFGKSVRGYFRLNNFSKNDKSAGMLMEL